MLEPICKMKLYLDIPDEAPSEIASGIRNHLRSVPDARIVYSSADADATISILAMPNRSKDSTIVFGYTLTYDARRPCVFYNGKEIYPVEFPLSMMLEKAGSVDELVREVSADLDSGVCEKVRQWNESARKQAHQSADQK